MEKSMNVNELAEAFSKLARVIIEEQKLTAKEAKVFLENDLNPMFKTDFYFQNLFETCYEIEYTKFKKENTNKSR
jgi:hypothetical protein